MSQFTSNFKGELIGKNKWKNLEEFEYHIGTYPSDNIIVVPEGFVTNFASIPRLFWPVISPVDDHGKAAVVHDYCYYYAPYDRKLCDYIFREALTVLNVKPWKVWCMYKLVRWFGWLAWWNHRKREKRESQ